MNRCRFLVDECVPSSLVRGLRRRLPDVSVVQVGEAATPPKGTPDPELLEFCEQEQRLLITADRATMAACVAEHLRLGHRTWGILVIGPNMSLAQVLDELVLIYEAAESHEWINALLYLPLFA
jgi:predicted nuclease of predicted toxin-antitoxin system